MSRPLEGLKVADLSWVVAGPSMTRVLADFGATVVRVESRSRPDTARVMQPFHGGEFGIESSALYGTCNAGKWDLAVDLAQERGRAIVRDLAGWADVLVESFSPGTLDKWGLSVAELRRANPELICLSSSLMGQSGPLSSLAGFGNIGASVSGFQSLVGHPGELPTGPYGPYTDYVAPKLALVTVLAALVRRHRTGAGCAIDLSQVEAGLFFLSPELAAYHSGAPAAQAQGNHDATMSPHGVYPCRPLGDLDRYVAISVRDTRDWQALATAMGHPDMASDPDLTETAGRRAREDDIDAAIVTWTSAREAADVEAVLQSAGVPAYVAVSCLDYPDDVQLKEWGHLRRLEHKQFGETTVEGPRALLRRTPGGPERAAPLIGEHTEHVLREFLGYSAADIESLLADNIVEQHGREA